MSSFLLCLFINFWVYRFELTIKTLWLNLQIAISVCWCLHGVKMTNLRRPVTYPRTTCSPCLISTYTIDSCPSHRRYFTSSKCFYKVFLVITHCVTLTFQFNDQFQEEIWKTKSLKSFSVGQQCPQGSTFKLEQTKHCKMKVECFSWRSENTKHVQLFLFLTFNGFAQNSYNTLLHLWRTDKR